MNVSGMKVVAVLVGWVQGGVGIASFGRGLKFSSVAAEIMDEDKKSGAFVFTSRYVTEFSSNTF